jgi:hypothetical protein
MITHRLKIYLATLVCLGVLLLIPAIAHADSTSSGLLCGSSNIDISTLEDITKSNLPLGKAYLRLNYASTPVNLSLYLNNYAAGECSNIGNVTVNSNTWVYIGNISSSTNDVIIQGNNVAAAPYQAAVNLLIVPDNQCTPTVYCTVSYSGLKGQLQLDNSNILSGATDQIAVYSLKPINGVGITSVGYYADEQKGALYSSKILKPFDRNYLDGGLHSTQIQIKLKNGQSIYVNETIDMGIDWTGTLYLKSLIYRNSGSAAIFIVAGISIVILLIILGLMRLLYKRRRVNKFHGIYSYKPVPDRVDDDIFISK